MTFMAKDIPLRNNDIFIRLAIKLPSFFLFIAILSYGMYFFLSKFKLIYFRIIKMECQRKKT